MGSLGHPPVTEGLLDFPFFHFIPEFLETGKVQRGGGEKKSWA
jgi:hypothetical protein